MKGIGYWLWIIGSVIIGLLIFSAAYKYLSSLSQQNAELKSVESFEGLVNRIEDLCWSFTGNKRIYTISIAESVEGIYAAKDKYVRYSLDELVKKIRNNKNSTGKYICIKIKGKRIRCEELSCNVTLPFMGYVSKESHFQAFLNTLTGRGNYFEYTLQLERRPNEVEVKISNVIE